MGDGPRDPFTPLGEFAASIREFHVSLLKAGFNECQAIYLTGQFVRELVAANVRPQ